MRFQSALADCRCAILTNPFPILTVLAWISAVNKSELLTLLRDDSSFIHATVDFCAPTFSESTDCRVVAIDEPNSPSVQHSWLFSKDSLLPKLLRRAIFRIQPQVAAELQRVNGRKAQKCILELFTAQPLPVSYFKWLFLVMLMGYGVAAWALNSERTKVPELQ